MAAAVPSGFKLLSEGPTGRQTFVRAAKDAAGRTTGREVLYRQDVSAFLDFNKSRQVDAKGTFNRKGCWGTHVAHIPDIVMMQWFKDYGITAWDLSDPDMQKKVFSLLNSNEWSYLRVERSRL